MGRKPGSTDLNERHPFDVEVLRIPPGKAPYSYQAHSAQWEFYHVISGSGVVRHKEGVTPIEAGDAFIFKPGEPHQITNIATEDMVVFGDKGTSKNPEFQKDGERKPFEKDLDVLSTGIVGSPPQSPEKVTITITGSSLHFHRDTHFWFETTFTLPAGTDPKQLHATIKGCPPSQADGIGQVVGALFKIEDGTLTLADYAISAEPPKTFSSAPSLRVLKKVQPRQKNTEPPKSNEPETPTTPPRGLRRAGSGG